MAERLADEILSASKGEGEAIKKRDNVHKMAEAKKHLPILLGEKLSKLANFFVGFVVKKFVVLLYNSLFTPRLRELHQILKVFDFALSFFILIFNFYICL